MNLKAGQLYRATKRVSVATPDFRKRFWYEPGTLMLYLHPSAGEEAGYIFLIEDKVVVRYIINNYIEAAQ